MTGNINIANTDEARNCCASLDHFVQYASEMSTILGATADKMKANWEGNSAALDDVLKKIADTKKTLELIGSSMNELSVSVVDFANEIDKVAGNEIGGNITVGGNNTPGTPVGSAGDGSAPTTTAPSEGGGAANVVGGTLTGAGIGAAIGLVGGPVGAGIGAGIGAAVGGVGSAFDGGNTFENAFWEKHGQNFADAWTSRDWTDGWDYSECEGVIDVIGQTADGLVSSVTDVAASILDTAGATINFVVDGLGELLGGLFG